MNSIFYATDIHLTDKQPVNRVTPTQPSGLKAFESILTAAKGASLILGGDLFESPRPSYDLLNAVVKLLKEYSCDVYTVYGNHDILYADTTVNNNALSLLINMGLIKLLGTEPTVINGFDVYGISYQKEVYNNFKDVGLRVKDPKNSIIVTHQFMSDMKLPFNHVMLKDFDADGVFLVLCGHLHRQFNVSIGGTTFLNTGCVCKLNRNEGDFSTQVGCIGTDRKITTLQLKEETGIEFVAKQIDTNTFVESVENAKIESQDVYAYIQAGQEEQIVKDTAIKLIKGFENA